MMIGVSALRQERRSAAKLCRLFFPGAMPIQRPMHVPAPHVLFSAAPVPRGIRHADLGPCGEPLPIYSGTHGSHPFV